MSISPRVAAVAFRVVAIIEALTWIGLLAGMYVKYLGSRSEAGVEFFGPVHGGAFIVYVAVTLAAAVHLRWNVWSTLLALAASVPPLATLAADWWLHRTGRLTPAPGRSERTPDPVS
ncbi:integral membrane protein [Streptomonospora nanhaiensis]|uniref:Integral membrane protein n=1 Tax=Streptomonospora nanhaiensis TaxID=1323731 RepID=A0A853BVZ3_9ACTN|nr:integral membrane protein [Streptomonospora nanhaiensis]